MGPPSYMWSVIDRNVIMRRRTVLSWLFLAVRIETRSRVVPPDGHNYWLVVQTVTCLFLASAENYIQIISKPALRPTQLSVQRIPGTGA